MSFDNNDFTDAAFGHPFDVTNDELSTHAAQTDEFDFKTMIDGPSMAENENWWLTLDPYGNGQYAGSTILDYFRNELAGPQDSQIGHTPGTGGFNTDDVYGFGVLENQYPDIPGLAGPSTAGPSTAAYPVQPPSPPLATFTGPHAPPSPVPTLSWSYSPPPAETHTSAENDGMCNQLLTASDLCGQWQYPTSVGKGKARATDDIPPAHPTASDTMWLYQQSYPPEGYDPNLYQYPRMGVGMQNTTLLAQATPSTGPQRSARRAKGKGKETDKGEGRRKRLPKKDLAPGVDWRNTCERFCAEMAKIYFDQPTGEVTDPETAYAEVTKFIREDLYLSPLMVKPLRERPSRDLEQYLTGILSELRPRSVGQRKGIQYVLERVVRELDDGLVVVNDSPGLLEGLSNEIDPEELDATEVAAKRRTVEQVRRESIRRSLERMTLYFTRPHPRHLWPKSQVLFYAITYLVFGARALGDGGELFTPKPQP